jgi:hypothetical protein
VFRTIAYNPNPTTGNNMNKLKSLLALALLSTLTACGGGGSSSDPQEPLGNEQEQPVSLNWNNNNWNSSNWN